MQNNAILIRANRRDTDVQNVGNTRVDAGWCLPPTRRITSNESGRFLYSRLRRRRRIDYLACFGGHQSNERFLYPAGCLTTSAQKTHSDGFLYSSG
jgi:hypothetical protein